MLERAMVAFLLLNGAAGLLAIAVAGATPARAGVAEFALRVLCAYLLAIHAAVLGAGLAGWLTPSGAGAVLGAALLAAAWRARRRAPREAPGPAATAGGRPPAAADIYVVLAALGAAVTWAWPHLWGATRLWIWDDYTYHMVYPALWLREGAIAAAPAAHAFTMQAWYPLGASVVAAWFMLPFHGVRGEALAWVSLTGPLYAAIALCASATVLTRLRCGPAAWALPAVLLFTSHRIGVMASSFSDADLAAAATLFAALAFAVPGPRADDPAAVRADGGYAALLAGVAIGIKVTAIIPALVVLLLVLARAVWTAGPRRAAGRRRRLAGLRVAMAAGGILGVSCAVTGAYWYVRNLVHTGNPLYPAAFLGWPGSRFPDTTLREYAERYGVARALADALAVYLDWPRFHAIVAALALVGLVGWLAWRRSAATRPRACFAVAALAVFAGMLLALPGTPYSAGNGMTFRSGFIHWDSMRYVALLPILGWTAAGFLLDVGPGPRGPRAAAGVAIASAAMLLSGRPPVDRVPALLALAVAAALASPLPVRRLIGVARRTLPRARRPRAGSTPGDQRSAARGLSCHAPRRWGAVPGRRSMAAAAVALLLTALVLVRHGAKSAATAAAIHGEPLFGAAAAVLDRQPAGARVAIFGDQWVFPAFGARDHLTPVRLDGQGRVATGAVGDAMQPGPLAAEPSAFAANLRAAGVDVVVVVHLPHPGRSPARPSQEAALAQDGGIRLAHRDGAVTIWTVDRATASR
jgi:hypothetical protein